MIDHTPKWQIIPANDRSYLQMTDHTSKWQAIPANDRSYPGITNHTCKWQIIPPNDNSYLQMTDHTPKSQIIPPNDRLHPHSPDHTPKWHIMVWGLDVDLEACNSFLSWIAQSHFWGSKMRLCYSAQKWVTCFQVHISSPDHELCVLTGKTLWLVTSPWFPQRCWVVV